MNRISITLVPLIVSTLLSAGELKVDINRDGKNLDSVTEVGYTKWSQDSTNGAASGTAAVTGAFTSATGENIVVTFAQTSASASAGGTGLVSNWYQVGAQSGAALVSDGISVAPSTLAGGGQMRMTITGLSAGHHTLLTYHNDWDNLAAGSVGPMDIYLNGTLAISHFQPSIRAATNAAAASAYLEFDVAAPSDTVTVLFAADPAAADVTVRNVFIDGFEIDTPNANRIANTPVPVDGDEHVDADDRSASLSWNPSLAGQSVSHDIYFGTDRDAVKSATRDSPEFQGNTAGLSTEVSVPSPHLTYYWRIDELDTLGNVTAGSVWSFRPRLLAFPGAEGYGRFARGGRGGHVVHVTSLADYIAGEAPIPGTLRYAVEQETGPRTIVFDIGGMLTLRARLTLSSPYVTVAGQTAPGKGICIRNCPFGLSGSNDSIVRFMRVRVGNRTGLTWDGMGLNGCNHTILDHCSISWSIDEAFSSRSAKNITLQRTLISEALNVAGHQNYPPGTAHGYAASIGGDVGSFHHNLLAHCEGRNWSLAGGLDGSGYFAGRMDITNNVVYNWDHRATDGGAHEVNFVANYYKPGASTSFFYALNAQYDNFPGTQQYYFTGNVMPGHFDENSQSAGRTRTASNGATLPTSYESFVDAPFFDSHVTTQTALGAYKRVLSDVGDNRPLLDEHDARVIRETRDGTYTYHGSVSGLPGLPDTQADVGGWEDYPTIARRADWDSDGDGLPDWWEKLHGTDPHSAVGDFSDANADPDLDGNTALDDFLAWLARPHLTTTPGAPVELDLSSLSAGYSASPQYTVAAESGGSVVLLADGKTARFTPDQGFSGLAQFSFTVTDSTGDSMTTEIGVRVIAAEALLSAPNLGSPSSIAFTGTEGLSYRLQQSTDLMAWDDVETVTGEDAEQAIALADTLTVGSRRFFRVVR